MLSKSLFSFLALTSLLIAAEEIPSSCGESPRPMRITARHIEANGVGYNQGYTTLEGFFAPSELVGGSLVPFLDLRAHMFNDGKFAANGGLGLRYVGASRVWGGNAYYDYRETSHHHYNQVSVGLESLGKIWDFRINGYLPVGVKEGSFSCPEFAGFQCHSLFVSREREFAMKSANAEVGVHLDTFKNVPIYFAAGPYYLEGQGQVAWGGELRAAIDIFDYVRLEGNTSYDKIFKWIGQGQLSFIVPFGKKRQIGHGKAKNCRVARALSKRALQRVDRNEIIPVDTQHVTEVASSPVTRRPYSFWFVDNTSSGTAGTFEAPFATLRAAQSASSPGDVIYVFPGNGTTQGMDQGILLKDNQKLFGAGIEQTLATTLGCVPICPQATGSPRIDNTNPTGICVLLGNACEVAGMHMASTNSNGSGVFGISVLSANIHDNTMTDCVGGAILVNSNGTLLFENNTVSNFSQFGFWIFNITGNDINSSVVVNNNTISAVSGSSSGVGVFILNGVEGNIDFCVKNNRITAPTNDSGILLTQVAGTTCGTIASNVITGPGASMILIADGSGTSSNLEVFGNTATGGIGLLAITDVGGTLCLGLQGNRDDGGFSLIETGGTFRLESSNGALSGVQSANKGTITTAGTLHFVPVGACACGTPCCVEASQGCSDSSSSLRAIGERLMQGEFTQELFQEAKRDASSLIRARDESPSSSVVEERLVGGEAEELPRDFVEEPRGSTFAVFSHQGAVFGHAESKIGLGARHSYIE